MIWHKLAWLYLKVTGRPSMILARSPLGSWVLGRLRRFVWRLAPIVIPNRVLVHGYYMYWHPAAYRSVMEFALGNYELDTRLLFQSLLRPGMVVVDLGANLGFYSLLAAKQVGEKGRVYAFEPQPWNCEALRKSVRANGYDNIIRVVQKAVSDKPGSFPLYLTEPGAGTASLYRNRTRVARLEKITAEATTLDEFFESEGWPPVHVIKMDIEGAEKVALEGMKRLAERNQSLKLIMEFCPSVQTAVGVSPEELFNTLAGLGFQKFWALQNGLQPINIPQDVPRLVQMAGNGFVNLFCER